MFINQFLFRMVIQNNQFLLTFIVLPVK